ncbi:MAG: hypothetical protein ACFCGT_25810 [Sandaracinaceae bacterium]
MQPDPLILRAIDLVSSASLVMIGLSTVFGALALVLPRWSRRGPDRRAYLFVASALLALILCTLAGVSTLMSLAGNLATAGGGGLEAVDAGTLQPPGSPAEAAVLVSVYQPNVRFTFYLQLVSLGLGLLILLAYLLREPPPRP